jgi:hypothetical protein
MPEVTSREFEMSDPGTPSIEERPALGDACKNHRSAEDWNETQIVEILSMLQ